MLFLFITIVLADSCSDHTRYYDEIKLGNQDYYYFDPRTHHPYSLDKASRDTYRKMIKEQIKCIGKWCVDGEWKCSGNNDCYHVEHIIPTANNIKEIANCSADILGNLIMSYGAWNVALSNRYYGEKVKIYDSDIVQAAYQSIYEACHGTQARYYPDSLCLPADNFISYLPFVIIVFVIAIIIAIAGYLIHKYQTKDEDIIIKTIL